LTIYAIVNQKGGVGKTTTTINLAAAWAEKGERVLVVDLDPQGGATLHLGHRPDALDKTIWTALQAGMHSPATPPALHEFIIHATADPIDLLPANLELSLAEQELQAAFNRERRLERLLQPIRSHYERILIDCPPHLGILTVNALAAADAVLVPFVPEFLSTRGLQAVFVVINRVRQELNYGLFVSGLIVTQSDSRIGTHKRWEEQVRSLVGANLPIFESVIPNNIDLAKAAAAGRSALAFASRSNGAVAYRNLAEEIKRGETT